MLVGDVETLGPATNLVIVYLGHPLKVLECRSWFVGICIRRRNSLRLARACHAVWMTDRGIISKVKVFLLLLAST